MALSAADLQKRHELEGAPDPFPSLVESAQTKSKARPTVAQLDTNSETAFPSLASVSPSPAASTWGPRLKSTVNKAPIFADSFDLSAIDLSNVGKDGKTATLGEVMKQVMAKYKVKLEASGNQKTRQTTFHIKAESQKELDKAKRSLLALLSPVITLVINAPASTIASIIGPKGATLKQIRDQTSVRVDIPKRESVTNGQASAPSSSLTPDDDDEEPTIPVTLTGPQPLAYEAQALLNQIISSKTSKVTQRVRDIPSHILPFVTARKTFFQAAAEDGDVSLSLNQPEREITASGDREAVIRVVDTIKSTIEDFKANLTSIKISLPKRQHRLLVGKPVEAILAKSKCSVVVPKHDEIGEEVTVWGQAAELPAGLSAVMEQANSKYIHEFPLPGPISLSRQLLTYFLRIQFPKTLVADRPGVSVFFPSDSAAEKASILNIDIVGDKSDVDAVVGKISALIGKLIGSTRDVTIDWLLHRVITGKNAKKLKQFHDIHNVQVFFPQESAESSNVLLVYDPLTSSASPIPDEKKKHLDDVEADLLKMVTEAGDVKSETVSVEKRWHEAVVGRGGTTLNAIIGEDKSLSIKVGAEAGNPSTEEIILVRGISSAVDRVVKEILQIVEDAKNDEIINSYATEFDVDREYVGRIVGAQGSGINKLRDQLGVKVDVSDEEEKEKESGKKKKTTHLKAKIKITGRKENVEEAKRRVLAQVERLADETSEILKIPGQYHPSLIGQNGKYAIRLEEKYGVMITFPRSSDTSENKTRENLKPDEVLIKGGRKGVSGAKSELVDAVAFEMESNNVLNFNVPTRSVARILGRGGATINEIKMNTDTMIDIDRNTDDSDVTKVIVRGSKDGIADAKKAILAISEQVVDVVTATVTVENKFHRELIGAGGQGLKDMITRCGGPSDYRLQAGLIRFPRQEEPSDEVRLRGEAGLVNKLKVELEKVVSALRSRVVLGVDIPASQHRNLIGRGGQHLRELQTKFDVQIQIPGSRSYQQLGEVENTSDLEGVEEANIVKVSGSPSAVEAAIEFMKREVKPSASEEITKIIEVPLKHHHAIAQQGNFFRSLRNYGVQVDHSAFPQKSAVPPRPSPDTSAARIDDTDESTSQVKWEVVPYYQDVEEGSSTWTIRARDQAGLERAEKLINQAIDHAEKRTHVGYLTLLDRSSFPRIVGSKGANVARLRDETGADITVSREDNTITIIGTESSINGAKDAIVRMSSETGRPHHRQQQE